MEEGRSPFRKPGEAWKIRKDPYEVGQKLLVPLLKKRGIQSLIFVVLTHEDADHSGGLQAVIEQIPVKQFLFNGTFKESSSIDETFFDTCAKGKFRLLPAQVSNWIEIDPVTRLQVFIPLKRDQTMIEIVKEQNARSVVFLLEMQGTRWLFTGDMEKESEAAVVDYLNEHPALIEPRTTSYYHHKIDVLKVAHHGSKTSTTPEWLDYWKPAVAVISVGAMNSYGTHHLKC